MEDFSKRKRDNNFAAYLKLKLVAALTTFIAILKSILHLWLVCSFIIPFPHYYFCDQAYHINEIYQNINLPILQPSEDC